MAEQAQARTLSAAFPTPPPFYKHFTKQNLSNLSTLDTSTLSPELRCLVPPEPPTDGRYKSFGVQHDLSQPDQSLESAGIQQLYPPADVASDSPTFLDPTPHLLILTRAMLLNFLELVGVLSVNPEHYADKIDHLQTLFYNAHDLINQYRPHQARESLIMMMEEQLDKMKSEVQGVREGKQKLDALLKNIQAQATSMAPNAVDRSSGREVKSQKNTEAKRRLAQREAWAALHDELG